MGCEASAGSDSHPDQNRVEGSRDNVEPNLYRKDNAGQPNTEGVTAERQPSNGLHHDPRPTINRPLGFDNPLTYPPAGRVEKGLAGASSSPTYHNVCITTRRTTYGTDITAIRPEHTIPYTVTDGRDHL